MDFRKTKKYTPNKEKNVTEVVNDPNHEYMFYDIKSDIEKIINNLKKIKDQQKEQEKAQEDLEKLENLKRQVMQLEQKVSNK